MLYITEISLLYRYPNSIFCSLIKKQLKKKCNDVKLKHSNKTNYFTHLKTLHI